MAGDGCRASGRRRKNRSFRICPLRPTALRKGPRRPSPGAITFGCRAFGCGRTMRMPGVPVTGHGAMRTGSGFQLTTCGRRPDAFTTTAIGMACGRIAGFCTRLSITTVLCTRIRGITIGRAWSSTRCAWQRGCSPESDTGTTTSVTITATTIRDWDITRGGPFINEDTATTRITRTTTGTTGGVTRAGQTSIATTIAPGGVEATDCPNHLPSSGR